MKKLLIEIVLLFGIILVCNGQDTTYMQFDLCCDATSGGRITYTLDSIKHVDTIPILMVVIDTTKIPMRIKADLERLDGIDNYFDKRRTDNVVADHNLHFIFGYFLRDEDNYNSLIITNGPNNDWENLRDSKFNMLPGYLWILEYYYLSDNRIIKKNN